MACGDPRAPLGKERSAMGRLRMYNVQFGDTFLLYGQGENLIVDFGSIQDGFCFDFIRESIRKECAEGAVSLLLTHFHKDHWSGLRGWRTVCRMPELRRVYLPDIFQMRVPGRLDLVFRSLLGDFLEAVVLDRRLSFTLAELLREILPGLSLEKIEFLSRRSVFHSGGTEYEVLWPRLRPQDVMVGSKKLIDVLERLEAKLPGGRDGGVWETLDRIATVLIQDFATFTQYVNSFTWREPVSYDALFARAQELVEQLAEELRREEDFRQTLRGYADRLSHDWNRISLVFHEKGNGGPLMTGDVPGKTLKSLVDRKFGAPKLRGYYDVIKAPHHGTESHFCPVLPDCRCLAVSNGSGHKQYGEISEYYEYVYGCRGKGVEICCTNPRCEFLKHVGSYIGGGCSCTPAKDFLDVRW